MLVRGRPFAFSLLTLMLIVGVSSVASAHSISVPRADGSTAATDSVHRARVISDSARAAAAQVRDSVRHAMALRSRRLNAVVVTASRRAQKVSETPVTTELISREDLRRSGAPDLQAALIQHVGIQPEAATVAGGGVQMQGLSSERVLVLIDGEPLVGRIDGQLDLSRIPTSVIERIEVIKGPQSTLYGSAAMGGVINVITRGTYVTRPEVSADIVGGSQGRLDANASVQAGTKNFHVLGGIGRRVIDMQPGRTNQQDARARRWDGDSKLFWKANDALSFNAGVLGMTEDQRWNGGQVYYFSDNDQVSAHMGATITNGGQRFSPKLYFSTFSHLSRQAAIPEPVSDSGDRSREGLLKAELAYNGQFGVNFIDAGIELNRQVLTTGRVVGGEKVFYSTEPYAQFTWELGKLSIVPGARLTYSDQWGTHVTPKVAALYHLTPSVSLRASVGEGYRAPEFKELYLLFLNTVGGFSYIVNGNPDLKPESSRNISGGIEWNGVVSYARLQLFDNRFEKFIETALVGTENGTAMYTYRNIGNGVTRGADVEAGTVLGKLTFDASYEYLSAFQRDSGVALLNLAKHTGRMTADYALPFAVRSGLTLLYTGRTPTARTDGITTYRSAYTRIDARVVKTVVAGLDVQGGLQDVFNARPTGWPGYVGRQWYVGMSVTHGF